MRKAGHLQNRAPTCAVCYKLGRHDVLASSRRICGGVPSKPGYPLSWWRWRRNASVSRSDARAPQQHERGRAPSWLGALAVCAHPVRAASHCAVHYNAAATAVIVASRGIAPGCGWNTVHVSGPVPHVLCLQVARLCVASARRCIVRLCAMSVDRTREFV